VIPAGGIALELAPLELFPLVVPALMYASRARHLAARGRPVPAWRQACFGSGLGLIAISLAGLGPPSDELLYAHMVEHLLIGDLAAILLVLGLTGPVLQPILAIKPLDKLRVLAHPAVALPLWAIDLYVWHVPAIYEATLRSDSLHALEHAMFIFFGCLMWMPILGPLPKPAWFSTGWKVVYVIVVRFVPMPLANVLLWSGSALYPAYEPGDRAHSLSPLADQGIAGAIMMVEGMLVTLAILAWAFLRWAEESTERQRLLDLAEGRGLELSVARASRAVAAGRSRELEERIRDGRLAPAADEEPGVGRAR
jgi:cytochrome c oxidase assembly factor CtaG